MNIRRYFKTINLNSFCLTNFLSCNANEIFIVVGFEYVISKLTIDYLHRFKFFIFKSLTFLISDANFCSFSLISIMVSLNA